MPEHLDETGRTYWTRVVYVIDLRRGACVQVKCEQAGSHRPIYVGQTAKTAEERFAQHKAGIRSSRWVRKYGVRVNAALGLASEFLKVAESEAAERRLAKKLRRMGYCVYGGH
jgi:predicted GIY-YIG superfamily endonuclease